MTALSQRALRQLSSQGYSSAAGTPLDTLLDRWWEFAASLLPIWISANALTLMGTGGMILGCMLWIPFAPCFVHVSEPPWWVYVGSAASILWFQTMDALDGKQARRNKTSSPLGQLLDHGCDALCVQFLATITGSAMAFGATWRVPLLSSLLATMFWLGTVVEYHTGVLPLNDGSMGVTEGQIVLIVIQLATARWGPALWRSELLGLVDPLTIMDTLLLATSVNILRVTIIMLGVLRSHYAARRTGTSRTRHPGHKSHGWGAACLHVALVYGMGALALAWTQASAGKEPQWSLFAGRVCNEYVVTTATGVLFAWQAFATIVAHMTNEPFPIVWQAWMPCIVAALNAIWGWERHVCEANNAVAAWLTLAYLYRVATVLRELGAHLNKNHSQ